MLFVRSTGGGIQYLWVIFINSQCVAVIREVYYSKQ